ncbi:response regulator [Dyella subtropica]|uniref:response regulator n=1 Tax=Dyella subtropica TaxID=2992127 RepID=UPI002250CD59|nr:response regulator [Dyella subtropica]
MTGIGFLKRLLGSTATHERVTPLRLQAPEGSRVLMVDDSPTLLAVLGKMLDQEGYAPLKAFDGESALELARDEQPAMIFLDIVLPGINGFAVLRALRHDPMTRDIPIVMISGNQQATEQFYVQRFGADDFIKKPFGRAEVTTCIHKLVLSGRLAAREIAREVVPVRMTEGGVVPETTVASIAA